jgi:hypothetical protein
MRITPHFPYSELVYTNHSQFKQANYEQGKQFIGNMRMLAYFFLEPLRARYGVPIYVSSCFRSLKLHYYIYELINRYRITKGLKPLPVPLNSQHLDATAVDFIVKGIPCKTVFDYIILKEYFKWGQLILENRNGKEWIHWSLPTLDKNMQVLIFENGVYRRLK